MTKTEKINAAKEYVINWKARSAAGKIDRRHNYRDAWTLSEAKNDAANMDDLKTLLIELDKVNRNLDRIKNDSKYIEEKAADVFKNHTPRDYSQELKNIINLL